jgi:enoyl-CoA hydratase/carnithine racemase
VTLDPHTDGTVHLAFREKAAYITIDRPAARNAMTWAMYDELASVLQKLETRDDLRIVVLRGAGGHFVAGTDIGQFTAFSGGEDGVSYERRLESVIGRLEALRLPTLAVIEGVAAGGGLALACACDLRICTPDARFTAPIARTVGNTLSVRNHARLVMLLGASRTKALLMTAGALDAPEAREAGFVLDVIPPEDLDHRVDALVRRVSSLAPLSLRATKTAIGRVLGALGADVDDALLREVYGSADFREGVEAFRAKRAPRWEGR